MIDIRYPTALQIVLSLAVARETDALCTSAELASALGANPALVRTLLVPLARDGIVVATTGKRGGVRLMRPPEQITLLDVYRAAVADKRLLTPRPDVPSVCVVSRNMERFFGQLADEVQSGIGATLSARTVAESLQVIRRLDNEAARGAACFPEMRSDVPNLVRPAQHRR